MSSLEDINWDQCAICQSASVTNLECPGTLVRKNYDPRNTYGQISLVIKAFQHLNALPTRIPDIFQNMAENSLSTLFSDRKAKLHKPCKDRYVKSKLEKHKMSQKRKIEERCEVTPKLRRNSGPMSSPETVSPTQISSRTNIGTCFFCDKEDTTDKLRKVMTFRLDKRVRRCALLTQNTMLLAKLENGDLIAQDALYHAICLCDLYRKSESTIDESKVHSDYEKQLHGTVLSELVAYIEETSLHNNVFRFKLADLRKMYEDRLKELGVDVKLVYSTRLKQRILSQFEDMRSYVEGKYTYLAFDHEFSEALRIATSMNHDDEASILSKAASIISRDIL